MVRQGRQERGNSLYPLLLFEEMRKRFELMLVVGVRSELYDDMLQEKIDASMFSIL